MKGDIVRSIFSDLPKVSRAELALAGLFSSSSINIDSINDLLHDALNQLAPIPREKLGLRFLSCRLESRSKALSILGNDSFCVLGNISNEKVPFALNISQRIVIELVYLLLGSETEAPSKKTTLSPVEEGIFSFMLSLTLGVVQNYLVDLLGTSIHLGPLEKELNAASAFSSYPQIVTLSLDLAVDGTRSDIDIIIAAEPLGKILSRSAATEENLETTKRGIGRAVDVKSDLSAIVGQLALAPDDLKALEVDDIVVLESSRVKMSGSALSGELDCIFGNPLFATATARLSLSQKGRYVMQLFNLQPASLPHSIEMKTKDI